MVKSFNVLSSYYHFILKIMLIIHIFPWNHLLKTRSREPNKFVPFNIEVLQKGRSQQENNELGLYCSEYELNRIFLSCSILIKQNNLTSSVQFLGRFDTAVWSYVTSQDLNRCSLFSLHFKERLTIQDGNRCLGFIQQLIPI